MWFAPVYANPDAAADAAIDVAGQRVDGAMQPASTAAAMDAHNAFAQRGAVKPALGVPAPGVIACPSVHHAAR